MSKTYGKNDKLINAKVGEKFSIELESNPTTGYQWEAEFDEKQVKLLDKQFKLPSAQVGSSGQEILIFEPIEGGDSTIRLNYKRPWETETLESKAIKLQTKKN